MALRNRIIHKIQTPPASSNNVFNHDRVFGTQGTLRSDATADFMTHPSTAVGKSRRKVAGSN